MQDCIRSLSTEHVSSPSSSLPLVLFLFLSYRENKERWSGRETIPYYLTVFSWPDCRLTLGGSFESGSLITGFYESRVINYESVDLSSPRRE